MSELLKPYGSNDAVKLLAKAGVPTPPPSPPPSPPTSPGKGGAGAIEPATLSDVDAAAMAKAGKGLNDPTIGRRVIRNSAMLAPQATSIMAKAGKGPAEKLSPADPAILAKAGKGDIPDLRDADVALMAKAGEGKGGPSDVGRRVLRKSALLAPQGPALMAKAGKGPVAGIGLADPAILAKAGKGDIPDLQHAGVALMAKAGERKGSNLGIGRRVLRNSALPRPAKAGKGSIPDSRRRCRAHGRLRTQVATGDCRRGYGAAHGARR
ncbi:MAG: hypothetical protein R3D89_06505 [Sphingomonadaceae bacterium]